MEELGLALSAAKRSLERYARRPVRELRHPALPDADALFSVDEQRFIVEVKSNARSASVARAIAQLQEYRKRDPDAALLLVTPFMGEVGAEICERAGVNWIDLRGNAMIDTASLRIYVRGRDEKTLASESMSESSVNPFSQVASRVVHVMLLDARASFKRSQLERLTLLDKGFVSKIVAVLLERGYVAETKVGRARELRVKDPLVLLDAWSEHYKVPIIVGWGLVAARSGPEASEKVNAMLSGSGPRYGFTGLTAAAQYTEFGSYRRVEVYLEGPPSDDVVSGLGLGTVDRGRNVVVYASRGALLVGHNDRGVRLPAVSPVLTYLDLGQSAERSEEAREEMRRYLVQQWK